jgi:hypothetical protein
MSAVPVLKSPARTFDGIRYSINRNAVCDVSGGGASYLPGNAAGSTTNGGVYA